jgi:hypothetical protein
MLLQGERIDLECGEEAQGALNYIDLKGQMQSHDRSHDDWRLYSAHCAHCTVQAYSIIVYISVFNPADRYQSHGRVFRKINKFGGATVEGRMNTTLEDFKSQGTVGPEDLDESLASHVTYVCYFVVISEYIPG